MLKNLDPRLTPEVLFMLAQMGHGDVLAITDRNYPAVSTGQRVARLDGLTLTEAVEAVLTVYPVDTFIEEPVGAMDDVAHPDVVPAVQQECFDLINAAEGRDVGVERISRFDFYDRVRSCFGVITTTEDRPYGCIVITKGVV